MDLPDYLKSGEAARLFPVLSETQKEGRTLSSFLACLAAVEEFGHSLLRTAGRRMGARSKLAAFTEVVFKGDSGESRDRPDGLLVLRSGKTEWRALVEAKVGKNNLTVEQVERYLELARNHKIDAVITISNQFTPLPEHHPCHPSRRLLRSVSLFHWSWAFVLTQSFLLLQSSNVEDADQNFILSEFQRFLTHPSAGVTRFTSMNAEWRSVVETIRTGGRLIQSSDATQSTVGSWHQETQDLALQLSNQIEVPVRVRLKRSHRDDPRQRLSEDVSLLCSDGRLTAEFTIPSAVDTLKLAADLRTRSIAVSMRLEAPGDRKSTAARVNWLLRQIKSDDVDGLFIRAYWPGRARLTQASLEELRADPTCIQSENPSLVPTSFEVLLNHEGGARFSGPRSFIEEIEASAPRFYRVAGQHLRAWSPPAPPLKPEHTSATGSEGDKAVEPSPYSDFQTDVDGQ